MPVIEGIVSARPNAVQSHLKIGIRYESLILWGYSDFGVLKLVVLGTYRMATGSLRKMI